MMDRFFRRDKERKAARYNGLARDSFCRWEQNRSGARFIDEQHP